ncbi:DNA-directed RNA polymerase subunit H [Candidatus Pacearchaeota archaeon]|nr:DNA-directed RNA polymerase subunit H [Candidatus Pacearchaeota archaeon]
MHILQPKHLKLNPSDVKELTDKYNVSISQLPKIKQADPGLPEGCQHGEVVKIERHDEEGKTNIYFRVVA